MKKGFPRIDNYRSGDFFLLRALNQETGGKMKGCEITHVKQTILLIKDWDGFQIAMRSRLRSVTLPAVNN